MANVYSSRSILLVALIVAGCATAKLSAPESEPSTASAPPPSEDVTAASEPAAASPPAAPQSRPYADAIDRASAAFSLGQSARSKDDWRLVASRWQQAIALLESVPSDNPNYADVPQKLTEYRRNLDYAQQQADVPVPELEPGRVVRVPAQPASPAPSQDGSPSPGTALPSNSAASAAVDGVYRAPIVRRAGGTPVIVATFDGRPFEMIVDTGASGTVITQTMAKSLGVTFVGEARVATASASNVPFQLGYVSSVDVAGVELEELLVAIAGPELSVGLLGQDIFSGYDVIIRQNVVEFHER